MRHHPGIQLFANDELITGMCLFAFTDVSFLQDLQKWPCIFFLEVLCPLYEVIFGSEFDWFVAIKHDDHFFDDLVFNFFGEACCDDCNDESGVDPGVELLERHADDIFDFGLEENGDKDLRGLIPFSDNEVSIGVRKLESH